MIAIDSQSFSIVTNIGFNRLLKSLEAGVVFQVENTSLIPRIYKGIKVEVKRCGLV